GHRGRARRVGAAVEEDPYPHAGDPALARRPVLAPHAGRVPVHVARERLLAVVAHLHGATRVQREERAVDLHREVLAPTDGAAAAREMDTYLLGAEVEARRHLVAVDVEP